MKSAGTKYVVIIAIAHWNAGRRTRDCIEHLQKQSFPLQDMAVFVTDNASTDGSSGELEEYAKNCTKIKCYYHRFDLHPGLTASLQHAYNFSRDRTKFLFRIDNDVELEPDALRKAVNFLEEHPDVGVAGPRLTYKSHPTKLNAGAIYLSRIGGRNEIADPPRPVACDTLLGAAMFFRVEALKKVGRWFDPELFLFAEEPEISWQLSKVGYKTMFVPQVGGTHDTALSTSKHSVLSIYLNHRNHTVVHTRTNNLTHIFVRTIRSIPRVIARSFRQRTMVPLIGLYDGLIGRKLSVGWWNEILHTSSFRRPPKRG